MSSDLKSKLCHCYHAWKRKQNTRCVTWYRKHLKTRHARPHAVLCASCWSSCMLRAPDFNIGLRLAWFYSVPTLKYFTITSFLIYSLFMIIFHQIPSYITSTVETNSLNIIRTKRMQCNLFGTMNYYGNLTQSSQVRSRCLAATGGHKTQKKIF
jgi:hypothetical protein